MARIAVRVAARDHAEAHAARAHEGAPVADRVARLQFLDRDELRGEGHRRLHAQIARRAVGERRRAIEGNAEARDARVRVRVGEDRGGVREAAREVGALRDGLEGLHRLVDAVRQLGDGEVRHQRDRLRDAARRSRSSAARAFATGKPSRFIPVLTLK
jgi:hypothetical protein